MRIPKSPLIYEIHTAVWLDSLREKYGHRISLANIPQEEWQHLADLGVHAVWLMGAWQRSPVAKVMGREDKALVKALPDLTDADILGSAYSIYEYRVDSRFGGDSGLAMAREQMAKYGLGLILDFVPNHVALDHPWTTEHPDYFVQGTAEDLAKHPTEFHETPGGVVARGRDPNFPAWSDVAQLNAFAPGYRNGATDMLQKIAGQCDGVRCDMAMLMQNDIFARTWGERAGEVPATDFWPDIISSVKAVAADFLFIAEVYWDREETLLGQGFDYCYDKKLYDVLMSKQGTKVRHHQVQTAQLSPKLIHFIENHDEKRAARVLTYQEEKAAAVLMITGAGGRLVYDGQLLGHKKHIPVHLGRAPEEEDNLGLQRFYSRLLGIAGKLNLQAYPQKLLDPVKRLGRRNHHVVAFTSGDYLIAVNYSPQRSTVDLRPLSAKKAMQLFGEGAVIRPTKNGVRLGLGPWAYAIYSL